MDTDQRELVRHLFAAATLMADTAYDASSEGQADGLQDDLYRAAAYRLLDTSHDLQILAKAITVLIGHDVPTDGLSTTPE